MRGWALPLVLAGALAALWAVQFHPFTFPNNDFYSFRRTARSLAAGELPRSLKRGPILPGAMAALAPVLPEPQPELRAALVASLAFSLAMFLALWRFAAKTFPAAAPLFAVLLATLPVLHAMALQPLVEPSLGCFVGLAFLGLRARSAWQYAAAGAAALSRPEALALLGILALANGAAERRFVRHGALAALGALPFALWNGLGALRGTGAATYLELQASFGAPALLYLAMLPKEVFSGWWGRDALRLVLFAALVAVPVAAGALRGLRTAPRETAAMGAWLIVSCAAVVLYGVGKARYLHPVAWVPLLLFAVGVAALAPRLAPHRSALPVAAAAALASVAAGAVRLSRLELPIGAAPDLAFAALALLLLAAACLVLPPRAAPGRLSAALLAFAVAAPLAWGGVERKAELVTAVHDFDAAAGAASGWLAEHLAPGERAAILHRSQAIFASGLPPDRVVSFGGFEAETPEALRDEMARRGVRYAVYTWRRAPESDAERFYARRRKEHLAAFFASGGPVPGFEHVATLPAPTRLAQPPAQIYRVQKGDVAPRLETGGAGREEAPTPPATNPPGGVTKHQATSPS